MAHQKEWLIRATTLTLVIIMPVIGILLMIYAGIKLEQTTGNILPLIAFILLILYVAHRIAKYIYRLKKEGEAPVTPVETKISKSKLSSLNFQVKLRIKELQTARGILQNENDKLLDAENDVKNLPGKLKHIEVMMAQHDGKIMALTEVTNLISQLK